MFRAVVFVSHTTCVLSTVIVTRLLRKWPQRETAE